MKSLILGKMGSGKSGDTIKGDSSDTFINKPIVSLPGSLLCRPLQNKDVSVKITKIPDGFYISFKHLILTGKEPKDREREFEADVQEESISGTWYLEKSFSDHDLWEFTIKITERFGGVSLRVLLNMPIMLTTIKKYGMENLFFDKAIEKQKILKTVTL